MNKPSDETSEELTPEIKRMLGKELSAQVRKSFDRLEEAGNRYTQYNFLVNAGGAAAVLAFLGTNTGSTFAIWPLLFFVAGVIACGIELLAMIYVNKAIFNDALNRRSKINEKDITIEELCPKKEILEGKAHQIYAVRYPAGL